INLADGIWLLFMDSNQGIEELDIPINSEFLVANQDGEHVIITEVYHVNYSQLLRYQYFSNWSTSNGLSSPKLGLYTRRGDLQNLTFKVGGIK
ncbi:hypothetical protein L9F63_006353, partial [Diploptera punctata]